MKAGQSRPLATSGGLRLPTFCRCWPSPRCLRRRRPWPLPPWPAFAVLTVGAWPRAALGPSGMRTLPQHRANGDRQPMMPRNVHSAVFHSPPCLTFVRLGEGLVLVEQLAVEGLQGPLNGRGLPHAHRGRESSGSAARGSSYDHGHYGARGSGLACSSLVSGPVTSRLTTMAAAALCPP